MKWLNLLDLCKKKRYLYSMLQKLCRMLQKVCMILKTVVDVAKVVPEVAKTQQKIVAFCKNRILYINKVEISVWVSFCLIYVRLQLKNPLDG